MRSKIIGCLISVIFIISLGGILIYLKQGNQSSNSGEIIIELVGLDNEIKKSESISYQKGDNIVDLIQKNFTNVIFENGMLLEIEDYKTPNDFSTFISIYCDGIQSSYGLADPKFNFSNIKVITLKITEFINEA